MAVTARATTVRRPGKPELSLAGGIYRSARVERRGTSAEVQHQSSPRPSRLRIPRGRPRDEQLSHQHRAAGAGKNCPVSVQPEQGTG